MTMTAEEIEGARQVIAIAQEQIDGLNRRNAELLAAIHEIDEATEFFCDPRRAIREIIRKLEEGKP